MKRRVERPHPEISLTGVTHITEMSDTVTYRIAYFFLAFIRRFMPAFLGAAAAFFAFIRRIAIVVYFCSLEC